EPTAISQLVRAKCVTRALEAAERVLGQTQPAAADLAALQELLADEDRHPGFLVAVRGERAMMHATLDALGRGDIDLSDVGGGKPSWEERAFGPAFRLHHREDHLQMFPLTRLYM